jgi:hypothetical protein
MLRGIFARVFLWLPAIDKAFELGYTLAHSCPQKNNCGIYMLAAFSNSLVVVSLILIELLVVVVLSDRELSAVGVSM